MIEISIHEFRNLAKQGKVKGSHDSESSLQQFCVKWFRLQHPGKVLYSTPNGGVRNKITGAILKAEGALAGVPDLFLMHSAGQYHGLYIEMKFGKNGLSSEQINFFLQAEKEGFKCVTCWSFEEFQNEVEKYLSLGHQN